MADDVELTELWSKAVKSRVPGDTIVSLLADPRRDRLFVRVEVEDPFYSGEVELTEDDMWSVLYALMDPLRIDRVE